MPFLKLLNAIELRGQVAAVVKRYEPPENTDCEKIGVSYEIFGFCHTQQNQKERSSGKVRESSANQFAVPPAVSTVNQDRDSCSRTNDAVETLRDIGRAGVGELILPRRDFRYVAQDRPVAQRQRDVRCRERREIRHRHVGERELERPAARGGPDGIPQQRPIAGGRVLRFHRADVHVRA